MSWPTLDRTTPVVDADAKPLLSEAVREKIRSFFPRYETKRAALLPALHVVQDALGHVNLQAMKEVAELLEIPPAQVFDTLSFYTHFWTHDKGKKVVVLCRSLACQLMGANAVKERIESQLGITEHGTSPDGEYSFMTEECLAACDYAPCLLINERLHKNVRSDDVGKLLADPENHRVDMPRSDLFDAPPAPSGVDASQDRNADSDSAAADEPDTTSDVQEMKDA
ncbi:MAG: NAD(P)H-dependent oxidoreductase subunit E [Phycisphaerae bacterium]